jgi:hypothetical protein
VLVIAGLEPIGGWIRSGVKSVEVQASAYEWGFEDNRYSIKDKSQNIESAGSLVLNVSGPGAIGP